MEPLKAPPVTPRPRMATAWLGGCSGCHMSLLDVDERLLDLAPRIELVHSPLGHGRRYPGDVDLCLVEGAVAGEDHLALLRRVRQRTRFLVALGDCAGWGNVTALRDAVGGLPPVLARAWPVGERDPSLPGLLERVRAVPEVVDVDLVLPGCPPPADLILRALSELVAGRVPDLAGTGHFG